MAASNQIEGKDSRLAHTSAHFRELERDWEQCKRDTAKTFKAQSLEFQPPLPKISEMHPLKKAIQRVGALATIMVG